MAPLLSGAKNILGSDVEINGSLTTQNDIFIDGRFEGEIYCEATLTIGANGHVHGEIHSRSVCLYGRVEGNVAAEELFELKANAHLLGDLTAPRMMIEDGATFVGRSEITTKPARSHGPKTGQSGEPGGSAMKQGPVRFVAQDEAARGQLAALESVE